MMMGGEAGGMEIPFDLNGLFHLTYSFDTLKKVIEWLAKEQGNLKKRMDSLGDETVPMSVFMEFKKEVNVY